MLARGRLHIPSEMLYSAAVPRTSTIGRLGEIATDQWGLVTRRQAERAGVSRATVDRLTARGSLVERVAHGVYRLTAAPVPDNVENPQGMETVCRALGAEPIEWGLKTDCCGASATVNDTAQALLLMSRIIKDAVARGANCFVTTCPMCQLNLDAYQEQVRAQHGISERLPVYLITELLGIAFGMNPGELQIDRHLEESVGLLKELKLA